MKIFDLTGKTALVTGGGRGLGRGIALALAEAGADVALTSRTEEELKVVSKEIESLSRRSFYQDLDVRDANSMRSFVERIVEEQGHIDILVNAAGVNIRRPFLEITAEDWDFVMDINLRSVLLTSQLVIPHMAKMGKGKIINFASLTSQIGLKDMAIYGASKGGVAQITKAMAVEFAEAGIQVNAIGPGYYRTNMTKPAFDDEARRQWLISRIPMRRTGEDHDLAGVSIFLASNASDYITGQTIYVDGGWLAS